jgi:CheY-like chemotaxis protein
MPSLSILVVDDNEAFATLLTQGLRDMGHRVVASPNGQAAGEELGRQRFDVVVTDIIMPVSDGFELIDRIKREQPEARIVAMSGGGNLYSAGACLDAAEHSGVHAVLHKPFNAQALAATLQKLFPA